MPLNLTLGDVTFYSLELPERIGPLGGKQTLVVHEFPGGAKTVDSLGAFPHTLTWSGIFTGPDAFDRAFEVDRIRATSQVVPVVYGPQQFSGKVADFRYDPKHQYFIPYTMTFEPITDDSGIGATPQGSVSADQALSDEMNSYSGTVSGDDGLTLPISLGAPATDLTDSIQTGLLGGDGTVDGISAANQAAIQSNIAAIQTAAAPLIAGADPTQASPALDLSAQAACLGAIIASPQAPARTLNMVNPNLFAVACQFLGDAQLWQQITEASGLPPDPQPIGMFTITVPTA